VVGRPARFGLPAPPHVVRAAGTRPAWGGIRVARAVNLRLIWTPP